MRVRGKGAAVARDPLGRIHRQHDVSVHHRDGRAVYTACGRRRCHCCLSSLLPELAAGAPRCDVPAGTEGARARTACDTQEKTLQKQKKYEKRGGASVVHTVCTTAGVARGTARAGAPRTASTTHSLHTMQHTCCTNDRSLHIYVYLSKASGAARRAPGRAVSVPGGERAHALSSGRLAVSSL